MAKRLSVVNFKGGVGKTTFALHLGCYLARTRSARVLLVDVDHQSSLSIIVMNPDPWEKACQNRQTVNTIFASYNVQGGQLPGTEVIVRAPFGDSYPTVDILPAEFALDDTEIDLAFTTWGNALTSEWAKRTLLCKWLDVSGAEDGYDFIIFDCPPATKIVSQNAIAASHAYVVPVIPDAISTRGVTHFVNLVSTRIDARLKGYASSQAALPRTYVPDTSLAGIVISNIQTHGPAATGYTNEHYTHMTAMRQQWGEQVLTNMIERAIGIPESLGQGWPVFDLANVTNVAQRNLPAMFAKVCNELLTEKLGW